MDNVEVAGQVLDRPTTKPANVENKRVAFPTVDYNKIADGFSLDHKNPPRPDSFFVGNTNAFDNDDEPTLSGRILLKVYGDLIKRKDAPPMPGDGLIQHKIAMKDFWDKSVEIATSRSGEVGAKSVTAALSRAEGTNGFHFDGETVATRDHAYYFNKSTAYWKNPREGRTRAYLTVKPEEATRIQEHFMKLSMDLFDAGIDFNAKATGVKGTLQRTDNMVFYISDSDKARAGVIMRKFLDNNPIAGSIVDAAVADKQAGLSWAPEPGKAETDFYQRVTGSTKRTSFNGFVAARAMPRYLERLTSASAKTGDIKSAAVYFTEFKRVNGILKDIKVGK